MMLRVIDAAIDMPAIALEHNYARPILLDPGAWTVGGCWLRPIAGQRRRRPAVDGLGRLRAARRPGRAVPRPRASRRTVGRHPGSPCPGARSSGRGSARALLHGRHGRVHLGADVPRPCGRRALRPGRAGHVPLPVASGLVRLAGDDLVRRFGPSACFDGALVASAALALIVFAPTWPVAVLGFFVLGGGVAVVAPLSFSAAARIAGGDTLDPAERRHPGERGDRPVQPVQLRRRAAGCGDDGAGRRRFAPGRVRGADGAGARAAAAGEGLRAPGPGADAS